MYNIQKNKKSKRKKVDINMSISEDTKPHGYILKPTDWLIQVQFCLVPACDLLEEGKVKIAPIITNLWLERTPEKEYIYYLLLHSADTRFNNRMNFLDAVYIFV